MYAMMFMCTVLFLSTVQNGISPLYAASKEGHTDVVDILLKSGANPNLPTLVQEVVCSFSHFHIMGVVEPCLTSHRIEST